MKAAPRHGAREKLAAPPVESPRAAAAPRPPPTPRRTAAAVYRVPPSWKTDAPTLTPGAGAAPPTNYKKPAAPSPAEAFTADEQALLRDIDGQRCRFEHLPGLRLDAAKVEFLYRYANFSHQRRLHGVVSGGAKPPVTRETAAHAAYAAERELEWCEAAHKRRTVAVTVPPGTPVRPTLRAGTALSSRRHAPPPVLAPHAPMPQ